MAVPPELAPPSTPPTLASPAAPLTSPPSPPRPGFWRRPFGRTLAWAGGGFLLIALAITAYLYFFGVLGTNFHQVAAAPGPLYRSAQLSADELTARVKADGIRTVLNLRGANVGKPWYDAETAALRQLQVRQIDIKLSARQRPSRENLVFLIQSLKQAPRPLLIHCQSGADRTGLACALERLLQKDGDFAAARDELVFWPYGHTGHFGYEAMDWVIDQFEHYRNNGGTLGLEQWAATVYDPTAGD